MDRLIDKYAAKMVQAGLADPGAPLVALLDDTIEWNRPDASILLWEKVMASLHVNTLIFAQPAQPFKTIIEYLSEDSPSAIFPQDCETRTFFHDFPLCHDFAESSLIAALRQRKNAIVPGVGIVATGTVDPLQAYVSFSSVCFAVFVKFFADYLQAHRTATNDIRRKKAMEKVLGFLDKPPQSCNLTQGLFSNGDEVCAAIAQAGRQTVESRLVDSFFGNISYLLDDVLYITQTASSMDELEGNIDAIPLNGSSCAGITASSELGAHRRIVTGTSYRAILHGHPKFSVILSLDCPDQTCRFRGSCYSDCPQKREVCGIPIVPGEIGNGKKGLVNTVPEAIAEHPAVIVYGHGVFAAGKIDFNMPLGRLVAVENACRAEFFRRAGLGINT